MTRQATLQRARDLLTNASVRKAIREAPDLARYTDPSPAERLDPTTETDEAKVRRHVARYERAIRLADRVGGIWWDVACGTGYGMKLIARRATRVVGVDKAIPFAPHGRMACYAADLLQVGWTDGIPAPDVVLSIETLEHLPRDRQEPFVEEIAARLRPDGVFVLACPIGNGPSPTNPYHLHEPTRAEVTAMQRAHFDDVRLIAPPFAKQLFAVAREPIR